MWSHIGKKNNKQLFSSENSRSCECLINHLRPTCRYFRYYIDLSLWYWTTLFHLVLLRRIAPCVEKRRRKTSLFCSLLLQQILEIRIVLRLLLKRHLWSKEIICIGDCSTVYNMIPSYVTILAPSGDSLAMQWQKFSCINEEVFFNTALPDCNC